MAHDGPLGFLCPHLPKAGVEHIAFARVASRSFPGVGLEVKMYNRSD